MKRVEVKRYEGEVGQISAGRDMGSIGATQREYVVGDGRVRNLLMSDYMESLVRSANGPLALSVVEWEKSKSKEPERILLALKLPSGEVVKDPDFLAKYRRGVRGGAASGYMGGFGGLTLLLLVPSCFAAQALTSGKSELIYTTVLLALVGALFLVYLLSVLPTKRYFERCEDALSAFD